MKEFKVEKKTYIKSNNNATKIFNRYLYCLIPFLLLAIIYNLIQTTPTTVINLIKSTTISFLVAAISQYLFNIIKKEKRIAKLFKEDQIVLIAIIIGMFSINSSIAVIIISTLMTIIIKNSMKTFKFSSVLYGILVILLASHFNGNPDTPLNNLKELSYIDSYDNIVAPYGNLFKYTIGLNNIYLSPLLSIIAFIYLFYKKSIKYNIVFSFILTISFIMLFFGLFNNMNIWFLFFQITTGNLLFLTVFCLSDYPNTPFTSEGQIIYGIILGIIASILRFIIPELSMVITLIIGPIILTKLLDKISFKLKYNRKIYILTLTGCISLVMITLLALNILIK